MQSNASSFATRPFPALEPMLTILPLPAGEHVPSKDGRRYQTNARDIQVQYAS